VTAEPGPGSPIDRLLDLSGRTVATHFRVRADWVSKAGNVTVRYLSQLRHIGLGKAHVGEPVRLLIADDYVRVVREDGSLLRELNIDPNRDYQPRLHSSPMS